MFGKSETDEDTGTDRGDLKLAACAGTAACAVIGGRIVSGFSLGPGMKAVFEDVPMPRFGRVVAVGIGPTVVMGNGDLLLWRNARWELQYTLAREPEGA